MNIVPWAILSLWASCMGKMYGKLISNDFINKWRCFHSYIFKSEILGANLMFYTLEENTKAVQFAACGACGGYFFLGRRFELKHTTFNSNTIWTTNLVLVSSNQFKFLILQFHANYVKFKNFISSIIRKRCLTQISLIVSIFLSVWDRWES